MACKATGWMNYSAESCGHCVKVWNLVVLLLIGSWTACQSALGGDRVDGHHYWWPCALSQIFFGIWGIFLQKRSKILGSKNSHIFWRQIFAVESNGFSCQKGLSNPQTYIENITVVKTTLVKCLQLLWPPISNTKAKFANCNEFHFSAKREIYKIA